MTASAAGLESLPLDGWLVEDREAAAVGRALVADAPLALCNAACTVPHLAGRLADPSSVVIVPLIAAREPLGVLLLAFSAPELVDVAQASTIGDAFVVAMERGALRDALALGDDLHGVLESLARDGSSPVARAPALDACCRGLARVVGADKRTGSIAVGKEADLMLVDGDVSTDLGALRRVVTVVSDGYVMDADELRKAAGYTGRPK